MAAFAIHEDMEESVRCGFGGGGGRKVLATITNIDRNVRHPEKSKRQPLKSLSRNAVKCYEDADPASNFTDENGNHKIGISTNTKTPLRDEETLVEPMSIDTSVRGKKSTKIIKNVPSCVLYVEPIYRNDIRLYLFEAEAKHRPHPQYMKKQTEITDNMRCILVDWLVSISDEYNFAPETLYLAVTYIDRFLSKMSVIRSKLQLVGVTAMMIAAKYEEIYPPETSEFVYLTNDLYTLKQLLRMEQLMLRVLSFDLTVPTTQTFIDEYTVQANLPKRSQNLAMFLSELCLVESVQYIQYLPSQLAASSLALSRHTLKEENIWTKELESVSGYSLQTLKPLIEQQNKVFEDSPKKTLQAVRQKFGRITFDCVSKLGSKMLVLDE